MAAMNNWNNSPHTLEVQGRRPLESLSSSAAVPEMPRDLPYLALSFWSKVLCIMTTPPITAGVKLIVGVKWPFSGSS